MSKGQAKLLKDLKKIRREKFFMDSSRACVTFQKGDITDLVITVLPIHGPFMRCLVRFNLKFSNYPEKKPVAKCLTKIFHPNICSSGSICYSLFGNDWSSNFWLMDYVNGLIYLLLEPNHNSPLNSSCVIHNRDGYFKKVQEAASGKLGKTYDTIKIDVTIKDSLMLAKHSERLIHQANVVEFEVKLKNLLEKIESNFNPKNINKNNNNIYNEQQQQQTFEIMKLFHITSRSVFLQIKKYYKSLEDDEKKVFKLETVRRLETMFLKSLQLAESAFTLQPSFQKFYNLLENNFLKYSSSSSSSSQEKSSSSSSIIQSHYDRVSKHLENTPSQFYESLNHFKTLNYFNKNIKILDNDEEEEEGEQEDGDQENKNIKVDFEKRVGEVSKHMELSIEFIRRCNMMIKQETEITKVLKRVYHHFENKVNEVGNLESLIPLFEKNDFPYLFEKSNQVYPSVKYIIKNVNIYMIDPKEKFEEMLKTLIKARECTERIFDLETDFEILHKKILEGLRVDEKAMDKMMELCSLASVCTYKSTGKKRTQQKYAFCEVCNIDICVPCAKNCHIGHRMSWANLRSAIWCGCGEEGYDDKCKLKERPFSEEMLEKYLGERKEKLESIKLEMRSLLNNIHPALLDGGESKTKDFEEKIKKLVDEAKKL